VRYIELVATVPAAHAEEAAAVLRDATQSGAWIEMPFTQPDLESDAVVSDDTDCVVHVYLPADADRGGAVLVARDGLTGAGINAGVEIRIVADEDWAEAWKEHFQR